MIYRANILVVDDDIQVCRSLANVLKDREYIVDTAFSGEEALELEAKKQYAILIVDLMMPGISGIELLNKIKKRNPDVTIILITGYPSIKTAVKSIKLGAFDYLPKPFTPDDLRDLVARALETRLTYEEIAAKMGIIEKKLVNISIPEGLFCIPDQCWVKIGQDDSVCIGIHHILIRTVKDIASIELPEKEHTVCQGEACARIIDSKGQTFRLWAPVTGKVIDVNEKIKKNFSILLHDPYEDGWVIKLEPTQLEEEIENLEKLKS